MHKWFPIVVEAAEIFNRLQILHVQYDNAVESKLKSELGIKIIGLENRIIKQIGFKKYQEIIKTKEYADLYEVNLEIYNFEMRELELIKLKRTIVKQVFSEKLFGEKIDKIEIG